MKNDIQPQSGASNAVSGLQFTVTIIRNSRGIATKTIHLGADGKLVKRPCAQICEGFYVRTPIDGLVDFAQVLNGLQQNECPVYGVPADGFGEIILDNEPPRPGALSRTDQNFPFADNEPGVLMLDFDKREGAPSAHWREHDAQLIAVAPELVSVMRLWRPSCSAFILGPDGRLLSGAESWHCYLVVDRASEIPRIGHEIYMRYWRAGRGYIAINAAGVMMDRAPIDASVFHGSRIDFAAAPVLIGNLVRQWPADATDIVGELPMLMTSTVPRSAMSLATFRDTSPEIAAAKRANAAKAAEIREAWVARKAKELKERGSPRTEAELRNMLHSAATTNVLGPDFVLYHKTGAYTVAEIMADRQRWNGARFHDPIDGLTRNDDRIAGPLGFSKNGFAVLPTHARGGMMRFVLVAETVPEAAEAAAGAAPEPGEPFTDLRNAKRLVRLSGRNIRFIQARKAWLLWDGVRWRFDGDGGIVRLAKLTIQEMYKEVALIDDPETRVAMLKSLLKCEHAARIAGMVDLAKSELGVVLAPAALDADPWLLCLRNGVIELKTGAFRPGKREDFISKCASVAYDPDAHCPQWRAFLVRITGNDAELIAYLARVAGYTLTGLTVEEVLLILHGLGANGKSTFRETIFALLGDYGVACDASLLITPKNAGGPTPELARLQGARLVSVNETQERDQLNESRVKFITGTDTITARGLYADFFDFAPTHKTWLTTNHIPIVKGSDEGIWRRIHLIPFDQTIPAAERIRDFRETVLMPELPGILNWALEGLRDYLTNGLQPPARVLMASKEYRADMDVIAQWLEQRTTQKLHALTPVALLHADYAAWAQVNVGWELSAIALGRALAQRPGLAAHRDSRARYIRGIELKASVQALPMPVSLQ
jgi:putative DNA primase/helicase